MSAPVTREDWRIEGMVVVAVASIRRNTNDARRRLHLPERDYSNDVANTE